jgi:hypothetical protein
VANVTRRSGATSSCDGKAYRVVALTIAGGLLAATAALIAALALIARRPPE